MCRAVYSARAVWLRVLSCKLNAIVFRVYDDSPQGAYFVLFSVVAITLRFIISPKARTGRLACISGSDRLSSTSMRGSQWYVDSKKEQTAFVLVVIQHY